MSECYPKLVFQTEKEAEFGRQKAQTRLNRPMYYYKCPHCKKYHLSHSKTKRKKYTIKSAGIEFSA